MAIVSRDGLGNLTVHRLAADLDYTVGALYRYFPSKEALIAEVEGRIVEEIAGRVQDALGALDATASAGAGRGRAGAPAKTSAAARRADALAALLVLAKVYASLPEVMPERFAVVSADLADPRRFIDAEADRRVVDALEPLMRTVAERFAAAAAARALDAATAKETAERAMVFWAGLHGAVQLKKVDRLDPTFVSKSLVGALARALLLGWGARTDTLAAAEKRAAKISIPNAERKAS
jgi:AcrR family transcriptional regulator